MCAVHCWVYELAIDHGPSSGSKGPSVRDEWYIRVGETVLGPLSMQDLKNAAAAGRITHESKLLRGRKGTWISAGQLKELEFTVELEAVEPMVLQPAKSRPDYVVPAVILCALLAVTMLQVGAFVISFKLGRRQAIAQSVVPHLSDAVAVGNLLPARAAMPRAAANPQGFKVEPLKVQAVADHKNALKKNAPADAVPFLPKFAQTAKPAEVPQRPQALVVPQQAHVVPQKVAGAATSPLESAPPLKVEMPPAKKVPAGDADLPRARSGRRPAPLRQRSAGPVRRFRGASHHDPAQEASFAAARATWKTRAKQNLMRLGTKWVKRDVAMNAHESAQNLVDQAYEMVRVLNYVEARKALEKASSIDPNSIVADFTLGLLNSLLSPAERHPPTAEKHFRLVLRRSPGYVPALNNLALIEVRLNRYADAVRHLKQAAGSPPIPDEVTQNLGRFVSEARRGRIHPTPSVLAEATNAYSKAVALQNGSPAVPGAGWLYLPLANRQRLSVQMAAGRHSQGDDIYDDHYCSTCNGQGKVRCPHCHRGAVTDDATAVNVTATPFGPLKTVDPIVVERRCTFCGGTGYLRCPHCVNGIDRGGR